MLNLKIFNIFNTAVIPHSNLPGDPTLKQSEAVVWMSDEMYVCIYAGVLLYFFMFLIYLKLDDQYMKDQGVAPYWFKEIICFENIIGTKMILFLMFLLFYVSFWDILNFFIYMWMGMWKLQVTEILLDVKSFLISEQMKSLAHAAFVYMPVIMSSFIMTHFLFFFKFLFLYGLKCYVYGYKTVTSVNFDKSYTYFSLIGFDAHEFMHICSSSSESLLSVFMFNQLFIFFFPLLLIVWDYLTTFNLNLASYIMASFLVFLVDNLSDPKLGVVEVNMETMMGWTYFTGDLAHMFGIYHYIYHFGELGIFQFYSFILVFFFFVFKVILKLLSTINKLNYKIKKCILWDLDHPFKIKNKFIKYSIMMIYFMVYSLVGFLDFFVLCFMFIFMSALLFLFISLFLMLLFFMIISLIIILFLLFLMYVFKFLSYYMLYTLGYIMYKFFSKFYWYVFSVISNYFFKLINSYILKLLSFPNFFIIIMNKFFNFFNYYLKFIVKFFMSSLGPIDYYKGMDLKTYENKYGSSKNKSTVKKNNK